MPETTYSYTLASFPFDQVNAARLSQDVGDSAIVIALQAVNVNVTTGVCDVVFKDELSSIDKTILDGDPVATSNPATPCPAGSLIGDHSGEPLPQTGYRADGVALVQLEPASESASLRAKGIAGAAAPAAVDGVPIKTSFVWEPEEQISFQGISSVDVRDGDKRDYMDLLVVFPLDGTQAEWEAIPALGPWLLGPAPTPAAAGLTEPMVLIKFGENIYVTQSGHVDGEIAEGVSTIAPPMQLVVDYYAHAIVVTPWVASRIRYWVG